MLDVYKPYKKNNIKRIDHQTTTGPDQCGYRDMYVLRLSLPFIRPCCSQSLLIRVFIEDYGFTDYFTRNQRYKY